MDCVSSYYLHSLTKQGGIVQDYGQAVLEYKDGVLTLSTYIYSTEHLGERDLTSVLFSKEVDRDKLDNYIRYFYNGFYCPYWNRFCEYKRYKEVALREINKITSAEGSTKDQTVHLS
jgi:hypothetical protein